MRRVPEFVAAFATAHGLAAVETARISVVLEELLTNLVKYGYPTRTEPGVVDIALELDGTRLTIELVDDGAAFDPLAQAAPDLGLPPETRPVGGLGIHIVKALADEAHYSRRDDRNVIRLIRRVSVVGS
jgi:anti-sigma regulatory factor (Ser/Thr protein kinase)